MPSFTFWFGEHQRDGLSYPTRCPKCKAEVFFVRHNGGCVWLDPPLGWPWPKHDCLYASTTTLVDPTQFPPGFSPSTGQYATLGVVTAIRQRPSLRVEVACHDGIVLNVTPIHNGHVVLGTRDAARTFYFRDGTHYSLVHRAERLVSHLVVVKHDSHGSATVFTTDRGAWIGGGSLQHSATPVRRDSPLSDPLGDAVFYWGGRMGWVAIDWAFPANVPSAGDFAFFDERCRGLYGLVLRQERIALFRFRLMMDFLSVDEHLGSLETAAAEIARAELSEYRARLRKHDEGHLYLAPDDQQSLATR